MSNKLDKIYDNFVNFGIYTKSQVNEIKSNASIKQLQIMFDECYKNILEQANNYLSDYDLNVELDADYNFNGKEWIAVYKGGSIFSKTIVIGINKKMLFNWLINDVSQNKWQTIMIEQLKISIFHEIGHALIELYDDYFTETDDYDDFIENNQSDYDYIFDSDNEEDVVEEFGEYMADIKYDSELNIFLQRLKNYENSF